MVKRFASPHDAETAFYQAFRNLDIEGMKGVWADVPSVYCIHPGGHLIVGYAAVLQSWSKIFAGAARPRMEYSLLGESRQTGTAVRLVQERIGPVAPVKGATASVLSTNIYLLTEGGWRISAHHGSRTPVDIISAQSATQMH